MKPILLFLPETAGERIGIGNKNYLYVFSALLTAGYLERDTVQYFCLGEKKLALYVTQAALGFSPGNTLLAQSKT